MDAEQVFAGTYEDSDHEAVLALWSVVFPNDPPGNEPALFIRVVAGYNGVRGWIYHLAAHPSKRRMGTARRLCKQRKVL
jgi:hypothetical protein